jgi:acetylornithine deacetylase
MPGIDAEALIARARARADDCGIEFMVRINAKPLHIDPGSPFVLECLELAGRTRPATVSYGTDGAMLGDLKNLLVCGPGDIAQAHTHDEWIALEQLERGADLYARMIRRWCCG